MAIGPSVIGRRPAFEKSNTELTNSLRTAFSTARAFVAENGLAADTLKTTPHPLNGINTATPESEPEAPATNGTGVNSAIHNQSSLPSSASSSASPPWTTHEDSTLFIPSLSFSTSPLTEPRSAYDITAKLFFLPSTSRDPAARTAHVQEAITRVLSALDAPSITLLIVSFPGISFDTDDDSDNEDLGPSPPKDSDADVLDTWTGLEKLYDEGVIRRLGVAEFTSTRLRRFVPQTRIPPGVDQINIVDCCVVPKPLILYAKEQRVELLVHSDCTDILPRGTVREILNLAFAEEAAVDGEADGDEEGRRRRTAGPEWLKKDIVPQWVIKYTAVVRDRGVIENKGYFAMAEIRD
jgi:glutamate--cysteine ligase regulatory subunit